MIRINRSHKRRGAAMVEMALVLPLFFAVILGIIEFGRAMMVGQLVTNVAREATRQAVIDGSTNADIEKYIKDFLKKTAGLKDADIIITIKLTAATGNPDPGNQLSKAGPNDLINIRVQIPFNKASYVPATYLKNKNLSSEATMRHE